MSGTPIYIIMPPYRAPEWVEEVRELLVNDPAWANWEIVPIPMGDDRKFSVDAVMGRVGTRIGPVIIFSSAEKKSQEMLKARLIARAVVYVEAPADSTDLWRFIAVARESHEKGNPEIPRKYAAAVQLVRKLYRREAWGV